MSAGQSAVSFLCAAVLMMFIVVRRVRENVAKLALVAWLLGCNLVHGINAAIWSSNADPKAFGWCDVGTIFLEAPQRRYLTIYFFSQ